jgi:hypothetical protein
VIIRIIPPYLRFTEPVPLRFYPTLSSGFIAEDSRTSTCDLTGTFKWGCAITILVILKTIMGHNFEPLQNDLILRAAWGTVLQLLINATY